MPGGKKISTDEVAQSTFPAHGRVEFSVGDNIITSIVTGPFNAELVKAVPQTRAEAFKAFAQRGPWGDVIIFRHSALASVDALAALAESLQQRAAAGLLPHATALVLPPDVEGARLLAASYLKCFRDSAYDAAGIPVAEFTNEADARVWLAAQLSGPA